MRPIFPLHSERLRQCNSDYGGVSGYEGGFGTRKRLRGHYPLDNQNDYAKTSVSILVMAVVVMKVDFVLRKSAEWGTWISHGKLPVVLSR